MKFNADALDAAYWMGVHDGERWGNMKGRKLFADLTGNKILASQAHRGALREEEKIRSPTGLFDVVARRRWIKKLEKLRERFSPKKAK